MSAPSRGRDGGTATRKPTSASRGRGAHRNSTTITSRGRSRGRGGAATTATPTNNLGLLQQLRSGAGQSSSENATFTSPRGRAAPRGYPNASSRARGNVSRTFNKAPSPRPAQTAPSSSPAPQSSHRDFMAHMNEKFQSLKPKRDAERKQAIHDGFLADPEKKVNLKDAITPVGTCTDMCPEFERVERIVQNMIDRAEKVANASTGRDMPSEDRMVKRFKRSAAGDDEQLPSDIRTPETLRRTLDYLFDKVLGSAERLAPVHEFIWNRTRCIRNDFSIQQVTKTDHIKIAVDCLERIARFHILSLHQLSNPDNLQEGEEFAPFQEREQLNNTLLSLEHYYNDHRGRILFPNEPEFRAYRVLFNIQASTPDLEAEMQQWPIKIMNHPKVQTARKLYAAAGNTIMEQGPLKPTTPFSIAQSNPGKFFAVVSSRAVSYLTACMAEMSFNIVRFIALDALWKSGKSSPQGQQARNQDWTLAELQKFLAFDDEDQTLEFCQDFDLAFKNGDTGEQCLDFTALSTITLDKSKLSSQQIFSFEYVEEKRCRRTLLAVISNVPVAEAIRSGQVVTSSLDEEEDQQQQDVHGDEQSLFIPETSTQNTQNIFKGFGTGLDPSAAAFTPSPSLKESNVSNFGRNSFTNIFGKSNNAQSGTTSFLSNDSASSPFQNAQTKSSPFGLSNAALQPVQAAEQQPQHAGQAYESWNSNKSWLGTSNGQGMAAQPVAPLALNAQVSASSKSSLFGQTSSQPTEQGPVPKTTAITALEQYLQQKGISEPTFDQDPPSETPQTKGQSPSVFGNFDQRRPEQAPPAISPETKPAPLTFPGSDSTFGLDKTSSVPAVLQPSTTSQTSTTDFKQPPRFSFPTANQVSPADEIAKTQPATPAVAPVAPSILAQTNRASSDPKPLFSFTQPSTIPAPKFSEQESISPPLHTLESSTTPLGTPKQPQLGDYLFQSVTGSKDTLTGILDASAGNSTTSSSSSLPKPVSQPTQVPKSGPSAESIPEQPTKPKFTKADHAKLIENTSRLILTQPQGLIEYFVSHHVSNILQTLVKKYLQDQQDEVMAYVRTRYLSRKFYAAWREKVQRKTLSRRAKQRRRLLAAAMQTEQEKKQRDEAELEAILAATQETKRLQEEQRRLNDQRDMQITDGKQTSQKEVQSHASQVVGQKRKTTSANESPRSASNTLQQSRSSHKRSRTLASMSEPSTSTRLSTFGNSFATSISGFSSSRLGQSSMSRSSSSSDLRRSMSHKVDSTKTDYFKLKAMGIDPDTPTVPDTARSLELRRKRDLEAKEALLARSKMRPSVPAASASSRQGSPMLPPPLRALPAAITQSPSQPTRPSARAVVATSSPGEDSFLEQLRAARQSLAQDADWFKNQATVLEKEIEAHEELRRSQNSQTSSHHGSPSLSINGLATINGYDYYPGESKIGKALSRTEERIRRTGAHGLATRPLGHDYVPVAMSRQSALKYTQDVKEDALLAGKKRVRGDYSPWTNDVKNFGEQNVDVASPIAKRAKDSETISRHNSRNPTVKASLNSFAALQDDDLEDEDDEDDLEEEEDEEEEEGDDKSVQYDHNGVDGDTEDNDEDDLVEDDDEEDEDGDRDADNKPNDLYPMSIHHYAALANVNMSGEDNYDDEDEGEDDDDDGTPGTYPQFSRAQSGSSSTGLQSGPGASADDAVVLSD